MKVSLIYSPSNLDWMLVHKIALFTEGKSPKSFIPTDEWKRDILEARHSPIRELKFIFLLEDIPYWVVGHLVRHVHAQPYVQSQRNDRQDKYDRTKAPQDAPVNMIWSMNAEELMIIANKRLCGTASPETQTVVSMMCQVVVRARPEFKELLVPACQYNGVCHEMRNCRMRWNGDEMRMEPVKREPAEPETNAPDGCILAVVPHQSKDCDNCNHGHIINGGHPCSVCSRYPGQNYCEHPIDMWEQKGGNS